MFVIAWLPCGLQLQPGLPHRERKTALNHLHGPTDCVIVIHRQQQVNVIRHNDEFMEHKFLGVAISKERGHQQVGRFRPLEQVLVHIDRRGDEIRLGHKYRGAKGAPLPITAKAVPRSTLANAEARQGKASFRREDLP